MTRDALIQQVKAEYARLASQQAHDAFVDIDASSGEAYFEHLLSDVIHAIEAGHFDAYPSGRDIVQSVANDHSLLG